MTHVLIVEDHEENRNLLRMLLVANGYRVTAAGDGLEALEAARRDAPDAIVSDALMPRMDGFALCRAWMQDAALKPIPFIFYSATYVRAEDQQFALALGAVRYLIKPLEAKVFLAELRAVLQQWAGHAAPAPAAPLDESAARALHESALARKLEDKIAQLEAAKRRIEESEARFRSLTEMSSDFYWESDAEHRLKLRTSADKKSSTVSVFERGAQLGERRWDIPYLSPDAAGWAAHRAVLDAHQPFRNFELSRLGSDGTERFISISGDPVFDASGTFQGYRGVGTDITERRRAQQALLEKEHLLSESQRIAHIGTWLFDRSGRVSWSDEMYRIYGVSPATYVPDAQSFLNLVHADDRPTVQAWLADCVAGKKPGEFEFRTILPDGTVRFIGSRGELKYDAENRASQIAGTAQDITEHKAAEAKIQRLTQLYAALSQCNEAIVRCTSEEELFQKVCRAAVRFGGMKMVCVGITDTETLLVRSVASFGDGVEYLREIEISVDADSPFGRGVTGTAMRENQPRWCQDFLNDPMTAPRRELGVRFGWGAVAALPLHRHGVVIGALVLYSGAVGAFDDAARQLLVEMAANISFAVDNFAREAARERAQTDLRAAEEQFRGLVEQSIAGIYIIQDAKFAYVNPRFAEIRGYASADELIGRDALSLVTEKDRGAVAENNRRLLAGEARSINFSFSALCKDGSTVEVGVHGSCATYRGRPAIIGLLQDISDKKRAEEKIQRYVAELETAFMSTVEVATTLSEMRDPYTAGHERRVGEIAAAIGAELGLDARRQEGLRVAGHLHDIGKITVPAEILSKPGRLSDLEYQLIKGHPESGYGVLKEVEFPWPVAEVALQHHERMDGSGYPQGLKGESILLEARIMAVADVIEAMSSHRPYRPGLGIDQALAEIERGCGSAYDTEVAAACLRLFRQQGYQLPA